MTDEIKALRDEIAKLEAKIDALEKKEEADGGRWKPEKGREYFLNGEDGSVCEMFWHDNSADVEFYEFGNIFRTKEEAECHAERVRIFNLLYQYADVKEPKLHVERWIPCVRRIAGENLMDPLSTRTVHFLPFGFSSGDKLQAAIDAIGREEFIRVWGNVENEG